MQFSNNTGANGALDAADVSSASTPGGPDKKNNTLFVALRQHQCVTVTHRPDSPVTCANARPRNTPIPICQPHTQVKTEIRPP